MSVSLPDLRALALDTSGNGCGKRTHKEMSSQDARAVLSKLAVSIEASENTEEALDHIITHCDVIKSAHEDEVAPLVEAVNKAGWKRVVLELLLLRPGAFGPQNQRLYKNATFEWWGERCKGDGDSLLHLHREPDACCTSEVESRGGDDVEHAKNEPGFVTVDLWHAKVGKNAVSFQNFNEGKATFFFPSYQAMASDVEKVRDYVGEAEYGEDNGIYYKRGRFTFKPLLWFDDTDVAALKQDEKRAKL